MHGDDGLWKMASLLGRERCKHVKNNYIIYIFIYFIIIFPKYRVLWKSLNFSKLYFMEKCTCLQLGGAGWQSYRLLKNMKIKYGSEFFVNAFRMGKLGQEEEWRHG